MKDIDFKGDVLQLAFNLQCCLFQGQWIMKNPTPKNYGKDIYDLIDWMKNLDQHTRPNPQQCLDRLLEVESEWQTTRGLPFLPDPAALFTGDLTPQHSKLRDLHLNYPQLFPNEITPEEKEYHDQMNELRADGLPKDGYVGQYNLKGQHNGRGIMLKTRSLYEGFFKNGQKFGPGREIKLSFGSPYIKVIEGSYGEGG